MTEIDAMAVLARFHQVLVEEIRVQRPDYLSGPFTVAEIYQSLVPYSSHRDRIGLAMNGDYEDALLRLLAGEGGYLVLESDAALQNLREELDSSNPNTGLYREYAAVDVRLNPQMIDGAGVPAYHEETISMEDLAPQEAEDAPDFFAEAAVPAAPEPVFAESAPPSEPSFDGPRADAHADGGAQPAADGHVHHTASSDAVGTCRWCRAALPERDNLNFCPFCGTDVHLIPCPTCGEELDSDWRFCPACGTEAGG